MLIPLSANSTTLIDVIITLSLTLVGISTSILELIYLFSMYFFVVGNIFCIKNTAFFPKTLPKIKLYTGLFLLFASLLSYNFSYFVDNGTNQIISLFFLSLKQK